MSEQMTVAVAVENSAYSFDKAYDYLLRDGMDFVKPGCRVIVPFGRGNTGRQGIVIRTGMTASGSKLKYVSQVIDKEPIMNEEMISLMLWLKERTFCTLFEAAKCILPAGMCHRTVITYMAVPDADLSACSEDEKQIYNSALKSKNYVDSAKLLKNLGFSTETDILEKMAKKGLLARNFDSVRKTNDLTVKMVRITQAGYDCISSNEKITAKQKEILTVLTEIGTASIKEICYFTGFTPAVVNALEKKGLVELYENEVYRNPYENIPDSNRSEIVLNYEQNRAYENILNQYKNGNGGVSLLFGVTGSGKTQVYIKLIDAMLDKGKQVIVMVPEIALTPQTLNIFHARYGKNIAVFHSALSAGQRTDEWKRVKNGEVKIVIGTRSAVFAPLENIGMIIIDEEHEHTYKSEQTPRYNAKDVARFRCAYHKSVLVLASATPSVETFANAQSGRYTLNKLSKRFSNAVLPDVRIVDMYTDALSNSTYFSQELAERIEQNLNDGKQSILLINRRGYNTFAACKACGYVFTCPSCSISMTYHHANNRLMCHYCGYSQPFSDICPECGSHEVRYSGAGTQKIEDELSNLFPQARVLRMDADSTMTRNSHEKKLNSFADGEYDILLGTQMVAKGLDFENVTLVGVINADQQLNNDDFRSQERTFDLLTQVVGRAGRGKYKGTAVIQTFNPENEVIEIASRQDYEAFYKTEISMRKMLIYPPYCDICLIGFVGTNEAKVKAASEKFFDFIKEKLKFDYKEQKIIALGPMSARISKISNKFRYRLILKCKNGKLFRKMIGEAITAFSAVSSFGDISVYIDLNPENIL
ncbi:MAG: primosomal protein N' [Ruminococcus sp.]|nr:primosomal protein N' [Candidatus Copronaster equi]